MKTKLAILLFGVALSHIHDPSTLPGPPPDPVPVQVEQSFDPQQYIVECQQTVDLFNQYKELQQKVSQVRGGK